MHSEHLTNLHPGWAIGGWVVAIAVTAALYLSGIGVGFVTADRGAALWIVFSMAVGFFVGGLLVGLRWSNAPLIHGMAITLFSVLIWFLFSLTGPTGVAESVPMVLGLVIVQLAAACTGGWMGRRAMRDPGPGQ